MGVAVAGATFPVGFTLGFEPAKAGMAVGPRAVVNASSRAIVLLGAFEVFRLSNIVYPPPWEQFLVPAWGTRGLKMLLNRGQENISGRCCAEVAELLNKRESGSPSPEDK